MYWTDWGIVPKIERASMDGTSRMVLHTGNLSQPYSLTMDYTTQTLYWADYDLQKIESSNADGSNRTLHATMGISMPFALTFFNGSLYWADWSIDGIVSAPVSAPENLTTLLSGLSYDPYDIHVLSEDRQPEGMMYF